MRVTSSSIVDRTLDERYHAARGDRSSVRVDKKSVVNVGGTERHRAFDFTPPTSRFSRATWKYHSHDMRGTTNPGIEHLANDF